MSGELYRLIMRISHKYHWHYAPPSYPNGDTHLWCQWCGFRQTIKTVSKLKSDDRQFTLRVKSSHKETT